MDIPIPLLIHPSRHTQTYLPLRCPSFASVFRGRGVESLWCLVSFTLPPPSSTSLSLLHSHTHTHRSALGDTQTRRVRVAFQFRTNPSQRVPTVPLIVPGLLLVLQLLLLLDGRFCTLSFEFVWLKWFRPGRGARTAIPAGRNRLERGPGRSQPGRGVGGALDSPSHSRHCTGRLCRAVRWRV